MLTRYYAALKSRDGATMCSLLTDHARQRAVRPLRAFQAHVNPSTDCPKLMTLYASTLAHNARALAQLRGTHVGAVTVVGSRASATVAEPHQSAREAALVKTGQGWRIETTVLDFFVRRRVISG